MNIKPLYQHLTKVFSWEWKANVFRLLSWFVLSGCTLEAAPPNYLIGPRPIGKTPVHLGVNVEVQDEHERCNLWDWLADSGSTIVRTFHPASDLRKKRASESDFDSIKTYGDFERFRERLRGDPERAVPWGRYRFSDRIAWIGVPEGICAKLTESGIQGLISLDYSPRMFPRSLILNWRRELQVNDADLDWGAAASAYEYFFAAIYRFSSSSGMTHYLLHNEPEYCSDRFYFPAHVEADPSLRWTEGQEEIGRQLGVLARLARYALEDVRAGLKDRTVASRLCLAGPASHSMWERHWKYVSAHVDVLDSHFYSPDPQLLGSIQDRMAVWAAAEPGRRLGFSEFSIVSGPMTLSDSLWCLQPSLMLGGVLMEIIGCTRPDEPTIEFATLYQFQFPATHRNFKSLVYGDMNMIDWSGCDRGLNKSPDSYPSFEQLQLRMATPAYHIFKMLSRSVPGQNGALGEVLPIAASTIGFANAVDPFTRRSVYRSLDSNAFYANGGSATDMRPLAVRTSKSLHIYVLNPGPLAVERLEIELGLLPENYRTAVIRECSLGKRDYPLRQLKINGSLLAVSLTPRSLTQIICVHEDLFGIRELKLEERTFTPGSLAALDYLETTRLRAFGRIGADWIDLTDLNILWESTRPSSVMVYQGGLVQRVHQKSIEVEIAASTLDGTARVSARVRAPESEKPKADTHEPSEAFDPQPEGSETVILPMDQAIQELSR